VTDDRLTENGPRYRKMCHNRRNLKNGTPVTVCTNLGFSALFCCQVMSPYMADGQTNGQTDKDPVMRPIRTLCCSVDLSRTVKTTITDVSQTFCTWYKLTVNLLVCSSTDGTQSNNAQFVGTHQRRLSGSFWPSVIQLTLWHSTIIFLSKFSFSGF